MKQINKISYFFFLIFFIMITICTLSGYFTFGHGLGDIFYLILGFIITVLLTIFFIISIRKSKNLSLTFSIIILLTILLFILKLTVLRGPEYPWNGKLFL
jgi:energy-coupling factor transporter transmembrane protein EcfT